MSGAAVAVAVRALAVPGGPCGDAGPTPTRSGGGSGARSADPGLLSGLLVLPLVTVEAVRGIWRDRWVARHYVPTAADIALDEEREKAAEARCARMAAGDQPSAAAVRVTVEVVEPAPRRALLAAPVAVPQAAPQAVQPATAPACHGSADGPCPGYWTWTLSCHQPSAQMGHDWCGGWVNPLGLRGKTPSPCACPCHGRGNDPRSLEDARRRTGAVLDGLLGYYVGALEHDGLTDTHVGAELTRVTVGDCPGVPTTSDEQDWIGQTA